MRLQVHDTINPVTRLLGTAPIGDSAANQPQVAEAVKGNPKVSVKAARRKLIAKLYELERSRPLPQRHQHPRHKRVDPLEDNHARG